MKRPYIRRQISRAALPVYLLLSTGVFASGSLVLPPELANATIKGTEYGPVTLHDGSWEGEPWVEGGSISKNLLELQVIEHDEDDPACCPSREATRKYDAQLQPIASPDRKPQ